MKIQGTERREIEFNLPDEFIRNFLSGFETLFSSGMTCEACLLVYMLREYMEEPLMTNDKYFREQFRGFCEKAGGKPFADSTIKKTLQNMVKMKLLEKTDYGKYRLHSKFFIFA